MHICEIAAWVLVLAIALLHGYMIYLRLQLEAKLEQKPAYKVFYPLRLLVFHHRYRLNPAYPDGQVYRQARHYDRLVPVYYLSFVLIAIAVGLGMQQGC
mgnify:CR=1 FL=1